jgi:hypothetical protein
MRPLLDLSAMAAPDFCYQTVIFSPMPMNCFGRGPLASVRQAQYQLLHQNATVEAITRQATDSLARAFHAIEVNHDQFLADRRASVQAHLERESEGQNGRLDVIAQEANAKAREARSLAAYHASLVEFEEARGTLLDFDGIGWPGAPENASIAEALELIPSDLSDGSHGVRLIQERPVRGVMRSVVGTVIPVFYDPFLISKFSYITEATVHRRRSYPQAEKSDL